MFNNVCLIPALILFTKDTLNLINEPHYQAEPTVIYLFVYLLLFTKI